MNQKVAIKPSLFVLIYNSEHQRDNSEHLIGIQVYAR